jgi:predicted nucleotidyltransferase
MRNPFLTSAGPRFVDREEILATAKQTASRIGAQYPNVSRILLFGSFARGDYGTRSDLDLLVILKASEKSIRRRIEDLLRFVPAYPTDIFPLTEAEIETRLTKGDPFLERALDEGILLWPSREPGT